MTLVVLLTVRNAALEEFRTFEQHAARIIAKHGGALERTVVIASKPREEVFQEVHIVTFPHQQAFTAYQQDEEIKAFTHLRAASVLKTEVLVGEDGPNYHVAD